MRAFWTRADPAEESVIVIEATADQAVAALDYLRATLATWGAPPASASVSTRLVEGGAPTAAEYAEAIHIADMLAFTSTKLVTLYAGLMHSMPIYRLYPSSPRRKRSPCGGHGGVPRHWSTASRRGRQTQRKRLDPSLITATRPQDVVRRSCRKPASIARRRKV